MTLDPIIIITTWLKRLIDYSAEKEEGKMEELEGIKNALAGNRTRVDSLEGYNSTTKPPMLNYYPLGKP